MRVGTRFAVLLVTASAIATNAAGQTVFTGVVNEYEAIRQALIENSTDGIAGHAEAIATDAADLDAEFTTARAGVKPGDAATVEELLPEVFTRAEALAEAKGLEATRDAFAALTRPLTRWQKLVAGPRPVVAYCPMEKKAWLQPDEAIGNPYAPSMLRCGEVVQR